MSDILTDEEIRTIREQASKDSGDWHFDTLLYARSIERAVLEKMGKQEPSWYRETSTNELETPESYKSLTEGDYTIPEQYQPLYAHQLPQQAAIPEGWHLVPVEPTQEMLSASTEPPKQP